MRGVRTRMEMIDIYGKEYRAWAFETIGDSDDRLVDLVIQELSYYGTSPSKCYWVDWAMDLYEVIPDDRAKDRREWFVMIVARIKDEMTPAEMTAYHLLREHDELRYKRWDNEET